MATISFVIVVPHLCLTTDCINPAIYFSLNRLSSSIAKLLLFHNAAVQTIVLHINNALHKMSIHTFLKLKWSACQNMFAKAGHFQNDRHVSHRMHAWTHYHGNSLIVYLPNQTTSKLIKLQKHQTLKFIYEIHNLLYVQINLQAILNFPSVEHSPTEIKLSLHGNQV